MQGWEYRCAKIELQELERALASSGADGWELVSAIPDRMVFSAPGEEGQATPGATASGSSSLTSCLLLFKRPKA